MNFSSALKHTVVWRVLNTAVQFFINLLMVRLLGASASGDFFYIITLLSLATLVLGLSLESGIGYYTSRQEISGKKLLWLLSPVMLLQTMAAAGALYLFGPDYLIPILCAYIISNIVLSYLSAVYQAEKRFAALNVVMFSINLLALLIMVWAYLKPAENYLYLVPWVYVLTPFCQCLVLGILLFSRPPDTDAGYIDYNKGIIPKVFRYSLVAFAGNLLFFLVTRIDYYFVEKYCTPGQLGNYIQVSKLGQLLVLVPTLMSAVVFPYSANAETSLALHKLQALCRMVTLLFLPVALVIILTGHFLFPWLFGSDFDLMYTAMLYYLPGFFFLSVVGLLAAYGAGQGHIWTNTIASGIALVVVVTGDRIFIPWYGINAAAAVSSVAYLVCMVYLLLMYRNWWQTTIADFFITRKTDIDYLKHVIPFRKK